ncbi:MAG: MFS transporter [Thermoplasmata archaeon]|nr:MFS transporter [Thermoplasmata archaeon]MCI4358942.1 MFS transporter [Thermoplasmata archaeon]
MVEYKWLALSNTTVATLMAAIDTNIVLISLPTIGRELPGTSATLLLWVLLGYSLVTAVVLLNFGRLSDMFGRVRLYVLGFALFTVGSLLCGLSQNGAELVGFRLLQALGAGFLFANSAAIITDAFPPNERGRALGINQVSIVAGAVAGLVIGGIISATIGWRWIFFVNVPIGIVATIRARTDLRELALPEARQSIDWAGNLLLAGGLAVILLGITLGALGQVALGVEFFSLLGGAGLILGFLAVESRVRHPMLDLTLFRIREFAASSLSMWLTALSRGAFTFVLVFYLQGPPRFLDPFSAGLFLIPTSASLAFFGPLSGWLSDHYGPRPFLIVGLIAAGAGFLWLTQIGSEDSFAQLAPPLLLVGGGMGLFAAPNRAAMMNAVPRDRRGVASGVGTTLINAGTTVSLGVTLTIMSGILPRSAIVAILTGGTGRPAVVGVAKNFLSSIHWIFLISGLLTLAALVPTLMRGASRRWTDPP